MLPEDLRERYEPVELLGEGGFGRVVAAHDKDLDRPVAIKLLHAALADAESIGRFRREAEVTARVRHPHVVSLLDSGVLPDGTPYLVYERIDGRDLEAAPPAATELGAIGAAIAEALATAHAAGVIHRDVKPANVLRRGPGDPVLADFGIARVDSGGTQYTAEGLILGTPTFMAPELYFGEEPSPASDQFAWAASLVAMAGCGSVYGTDEVSEILDLIRRPDPIRLAPGTRQVLGPLAPVVLRALAPDPARRHRDCTTFARRLLAPPAQDAADGPGTSNPLRQEPGVTSRDSTVAMPAFSSRAGTTRKLLLGDGTGRALALRGLVAVGLAGLLGWGLLSRPAARPGELPTTPQKPPTRSEFPQARRDLSDAAIGLRTLLAPRPPGDLEKPSYEEQVAAYPRLTDPKTQLIWNRWLEALEVWLGAVSPEELEQVEVLSQLITDGVQLSDYFLSYINEIKYAIQHGSTAFGAVAEIKSIRRRRHHDDWSITAWNSVEQDLILSTEETLCRLDRLPLDEKPAGALVLAVLVSQLQLVSPSRYLGPDDPCRDTTRERMILYLQLMHLEILEREDLAAALPWLRSLVRLLARVSDSGLLPPEDRVTYLEELVAHADLIDDPAPRALREEFWRRLMIEVWRAPYRDPNDPRDRALALLERVFPRYTEVADANPAGAVDAHQTILAFPSQNYTSEIPELMAKRPELAAVVERVAP